jgi:glycosyltransferase involved in cell wall biosynthesis
MKHVHINGKWLGQRLTGTQRFAAEVAGCVVATEEIGVVLHVPRGAEAPSWASAPHVEVRRAPLGGVLFEQLYLPLATAGQFLLNFAGPAPLLKRRQLVTMHDATPFRFPETYKRTFVLFYYVLYMLLSRTARQLATVTAFSAEELADVLHISPDRFMVVGCAADTLARTEAVRPALIRDSHPYLVVGTLAKHKNVTDPVAAVTSSGRQVVVVGASGSQQVFAPAENAMAEATVAGRLSDSELVWMYQNSRALIFPSRYEGFGLPVLEAQSLGCPVVSSNAASLPEVAGVAALYFEPDDLDQLVSILETLEDDEELAERLRRDGLRNAQRFSWRQSADKVVAWAKAELA